MKKKISDRNNEQNKDGCRKVIETQDFFLCASQRGKINTINKISNGEGVLLQIQMTSIDYFMLFRRLVLIIQLAGIEECINSSDTRVTTKMNAGLTKEFIANEIE